MLNGKIRRTFFTRAVLSPGNRAKRVKANGELHTYNVRYNDRKRKLAFSTTVLSFDTTSSANPDEYRRKPYVARNRGLHLCR